MYFADLIDDLSWWGAHIYEFFRELPPYDWLESPLYELKLILYSLPFVLITLIPILLLIRCSRRYKKLVKSQINVVKHTFVCPHCGHAPEQPPVSGTYYCGRCGKATKVAGQKDQSFSLKY
ncbi:MAG: hypothetical protein ACXAC8_10100 [Candidatus Hodarchaeales archaeon]|jgi:DNA-directed RNA polymerase subunit RPC12/RpoP